MRFWVAFSIGVAAGATVALLYAPQTGVRTRRQLRRGFEDASDCVRNTAEAISGQTGKYMKRGMKMAGNVRDTATTAYGAARKVVTI